MLVGAMRDEVSEEFGLKVLMLVLLLTSNSYLVGPFLLNPQSPLRSGRKILPKCDPD